MPLESRLDTLTRVSNPDLTIQNGGPCILVCTHLCAREVALVNYWFTPVPMRT